jgi:hypothetical protein
MEDLMSRCLALLVVSSLVCGGCSSPADSGGGGDPGVTTSVASGDGAVGPAAGGSSSGETDDIPAGKTAGTGHAPPSEFDRASGPKVTVSGTLALEGAEASEGTLIVDVEVYEADKQPQTRLVHSIELAEPGAWSFEAPASFGLVLVHGFLDLNDNGPGPGEPMGGAAPFAIGEVDINGIELVAKIQPPPDAGDLPPDTMAQGEDGLPVSTATPAAE